MLPFVAASDLPTVAFSSIVDYGHCPGRWPISCLDFHRLLLPAHAAKSGLKIFMMLFIPSPTSTITTAVPIHGEAHDATLGLNSCVWGKRDGHGHGHGSLMHGGGPRYLLLFGFIRGLIQAESRMSWMLFGLGNDASVSQEPIDL